MDLLSGSYSWASNYVKSFAITKPKDQETLMESSNSDPEQNHGNLAKDAGVTMGTATAAGVLVPKLATVGLTFAGFTSNGIAAGSFAAATQAGIGNVAAGSLFASFQSLGATGGFAIFGPVGIGAAAVVGTGVAAWKIRQQRSKL